MTTATTTAGHELSTKDLTPFLCKQGETQAGIATITLERDDTTVVVKGVPASVCANCGEQYVSEEITARLLKSTEKAARAGVQVDVREYIAA